MGKELTAVSPEYSSTIHIDFDDPKEVRGHEVGQKIRVVITGIIRSVEQRESWENPKKMISSMCLKDFEAEVVALNGDLAELLDEDD